jgi:hypothetical protein
VGTKCRYRSTRECNRLFVVDEEAEGRRCPDDLLTCGAADILGRTGNQPVVQIHVYSCPLVANVVQHVSDDVLCHALRNGWGVAPSERQPGVVVRVAVVLEEEWVIHGSWECE